MAFVIGIVTGFINHNRLDNEVISQYLIFPKAIISPLFGLLVFSVILLVFQVYPSLFISDKTKDSWTVSKEFSLVGLLLLTVVIVNYLFFILLSKDTTFFLSLPFLIKIIAYVLSTGLSISAIIIWINYTIILKENLKQSQQHNKKLKELIHQKNDNEAEISISTDIQSEQLKLKLNDLLFIKSDGNYVDVFTWENEKISKTLYRIQLQKIEEELKNYPQIIRSHRSYLVNLHKIRHTKGTVRNYKLYFDDSELSAPVSRNRFALFNDALYQIDFHSTL